MKCFGKLNTCNEIEIRYIVVIGDGCGSFFNGSVWCEKCMGESFRDGNPYLKIYNPISVPKKGT